MTTYAVHFYFDGAGTYPNSYASYVTANAGSYGGPPYTGVV